MRKKEIAREERLKRQKEEKQRSREKAREEKFSPPPIRINHKEKRSSFLSTTSAPRPPNRSTSPTKAQTPSPGKSSLRSVLPKGYASVGLHPQLQSMWMAILRWNQSKPNQKPVLFRPLNSHLMMISSQSYQVFTHWHLYREFATLFHDFLHQSNLVHSVETRW